MRLRHLLFGTELCTCLVESHHLLINDQGMTLQISPLGLVPKKKVGEYWVIHHLSYPDHLSINDGIPQDKCTVQYQTIDEKVIQVLYTS
jgi:hypothetical protein